jgi:iron complex transport system ATP-binding protein
VSAVRVTSLSFAYRTRPVLAEVSFELPPGSLTAILGRNGSGKSTLLRCLAGLLPLPPGTVRVAGRDLALLSCRERARLLGYLPQFHQPAFDYAVEEVVLTGRAPWVGLTPREEDLRQAREALALLDIAHLAGRPYTELSGGERQLVLLARILAQNPGVILLDEPLSHLDLCHQVRLLRLLGEFSRQGRTVVAVLHDPTLALQHFHRQLYLRQGRLLAPPGPPGAEFLSRIYETPVEVLQSATGPVVVPRGAGQGEGP